VGTFNETYQFAIVKAEALDNPLSLYGERGKGNSGTASRFA
jgi:hypothetical protein